MSAGRSKQNLVFTIAMVSSLAFFFHNCSKVGFTPENKSSLGKNPDGSDRNDQDTEDPVAPPPLVKNYAEVEAGARNIPPIKIFVIADNSFSMVENNIKLADSMPSMFSSSEAESLAPFETSVYVINTSQRTPAYSSADLGSLSSLQLTREQIQNLDFNLVSSSYRTASLNSGAIPGDNIGYAVLKEESEKLKRFTLAPAPILGLFEGAAGKIEIRDAIRKSKDSDASLLTAEFKQRLGLASAARAPATSSGKLVYGDIMDSESGLCAISRILRSPNGLLKPGEQSAFLIASDEDEADKDGKNCVYSYSDITGETALYDYQCEERSTKVEYTRAYPQSDVCDISFATGYKFTYIWKIPKVETKVSYQAASYSTPKTILKYSTAVYKRMKTQVSYFVKTCPPPLSNDGVLIYPPCTSKPESQTIAGEVTNCLAKARELAGARASDVESTGANVPVCKRADVDDSTCKQTDLSCVLGSINSTLSTATIRGDRRADCQALAASQANVFIDSTHQPQCQLDLANPYRGDGLCSASDKSIGCVETIDPVQRTAVVGGNATSTTACLDQAKKQKGSIANSTTYIPTCTLLPSTQFVEQKVSGNLPFSESQAVDGNVTQTSCGAVGSSFLQKIYDKAKILNASAPAPSASSFSSCSIDSLSVTKASPALTEGKTCEQIRVATCGDTLKNRNCNLIAQSPRPDLLENLSFSVNEEVLNCDVKCKSAYTELCPENPNVVINDSTTLAEYLKGVYGAKTTCKVSAPVAVKVGTEIKGQTAEDKGKVCASVNGKLLYTKTVRGPYYSKELVTDYVSGTSKDNATYVPAKNLTDYIDDRADQLLEGLPPIVAAFVHKSSSSISGSIGSVGTTYMDFVERMGGESESVLTDDYSVALKKVSSLLKSVIDRSFSIPQIKPFQRVRQVWIQRKNSSSRVLLSLSDWKASGDAVTIEATVSFDLGDKFIFEYY